MAANINMLTHTLSRLGDYTTKFGFVNSISQLFRDIRSHSQSIRVMRFAVGVTLAVLVVSTIEWPLSFLVPILTSVFLALPFPMPSLKAGLTNMLYTVSSFGIGLALTLFLLPFPLIYIPVLGLVLFNLYYFLNRGGSFWFVLMSILAVLILPLLGNVHEGLAAGFTFGFVFCGWVTVVMIWIAHLLVPDKTGTPGLPRKPGFQPGYSQPAAQAALKSTIVVLPIVILFITFEFTGQILVMVFAAIFSLSPVVAKGKIAGINSMKSTMIGGFYAFIFYALLVAVPEFYFFIVDVFNDTVFCEQYIFWQSIGSLLWFSIFDVVYFD
jgi:hypothetical protein